MKYTILTQNYFQWQQRHLPAVSAADLCLATATPTGLSSFLSAVLHVVVTAAAAFDLLLDFLLDFWVRSTPVNSKYNLPYWVHCTYTG